MKTIPQRLAEELAVQESRVAAAIALLDEGATVPFIARYRKEATGGLDDTQLRTLEQRLRYLRELDERREVVLKTIAEQGKLTPQLEEAIRQADTKVRLEDLYRPYKPKRRTKAQAAREAGLEPLAQALLADPSLVPEEAAQAYINAELGVADAAAALEGARQILMERFSEDADLIGALREAVWKHARLRSQVIEAKKTAGAKYSDYFDYSEQVSSVPSHRALALFRGRKEGFLRLALVLPEPEEKSPPLSTDDACQAFIAHRFEIEDQGRSADAWLIETARSAWRAKIFVHLGSELERRLRESAELEAIRVFSRNLKDLLMAAPAGPRAAMGLDPGFRTGVKAAIVDQTGKLLEAATIYPHQPKNKWQESLQLLAELCAKHNVDLAAIGNGTASRETDRLIAELIKEHPDLDLQRIVISEAGASVYSASQLAAEEFPDLDVSMRGAVSIARRLQDPLAELVKIEPKAIGVGQYQHDVNQPELARTLDAVVEDCVNAVGVDVNTASAPLLSRVSGLDQAVARNLVSYRDENGPYQRRADLLNVPRMGAKTFELAAGFLRIPGGVNPLDASAVHPEAYPVVERIIQATGKEVKELVGNKILLGTLTPNDFIDERFGEPTVCDILSELEKPGRDPRPEFKTAAFKEGVEQISDLNEGLELEGVVTNVTNFGAFVDIGVHQDGLVHISELANRFVKDPHDVVKPGDVVEVRVISVDAERKRIGLSMRSEASRAAKAARSASKGADGERKKPRRPRRPRRRGPEEARAIQDRTDQKTAAAPDSGRGSRPSKKRGESPRKPARPNTAMAAAFARMKTEKTD